MNIILWCPFCGTRFYNNAAKSSGNNKKKLPPICVKSRLKCDGCSKEKIFLLPLLLPLIKYWG